jgi:CMP/dCMP kinase
LLETSVLDGDSNLKIHFFKGDFGPLFYCLYFPYFRDMLQNKKITIAVDGFSSCGKSTLARALAKELGYTFIDSGAMYRGIALFCLQHEFIVDGIPNEEAINATIDSIQLSFGHTATGEQFLCLNGENVEQEIRKPQVASVVSTIATLKAVREKLVNEQREMGKNGGIVMDGRDIGSVVFPKAELKLFITADPDVRAQRRYDELQSKGILSSLEEVKKNLLERDHIDSTRTISPLIQTDDAVVIDNSNLNREEQLKLALEYAKERMS